MLKCGSSLLNWTTSGEKKEKSQVNKYVLWGPKKYSSGPPGFSNQYNLKSKRTLKQEALYSVMSNFNFDIYHVDFNSSSIDWDIITAFEFELTFLENAGYVEN